MNKLRGATRDDLIADMANQIVDGMDSKTMYQMCYELIVENLEDLPEMDLCTEAEEMGFDLFDYNIPSEDIA